MFHIEGVGNSTFLVYDTEEEKIDELGMGMLTNNVIDGLLRFSCVRKDETRILNYDITTMIPLRQYFENYLHMEQVIHIFRSIADGIVSAGEYMLETDRLMLNPDYIYIEVNSGNCRLLYLPVTGMGQERNLSEVFKRLLLEIRYDVQDDNAYMTEIINYLNGNQKLDCRKFEQWLAELAVRKERDEASAYREVRPRAEYAAGQPERFERKEVTQANQPDTVPVREAENAVYAGNTPKGQEEKKKGFFSGLGGKGKEEKKESGKQDKKREKKQEKEEKKQEKMREKQEKKEAKKKGQKKEASKAAGVNPYFAIPNQGREEKPKAGMAVPVAVPSGPKAGMAVPGAAPSGAGMGIQVPGAGQGNLVNGSSGEKGYGEEYRQEAEKMGRTGLDFGDTVVMGDQEDSSTVILSSQMQIADGIPYLKRMKNGQKMYIDKPLLKIGREGSYVDFYIGDNPSVSRSHADIIRENGVYYIRDNNSSNHTYVEAEMLTGGQKVKLGHGTKIRISDEEFVFYMY